MLAGRRRKKATWQAALPASGTAQGPEVPGVLEGERKQQKIGEKVYR